MNPVTVLVGLVLLGVGAFAIARGRKRRHQKATIEGTETTDVLRLTPGPVEVVGRAVPTDDGPMRAPFSEEDCLVAYWEIEEWEESGKHSSWDTEGSGYLATPFYVDDGTDRVLIRPDGATLDIDRHAEPVIEVGADETPPRAIQEFLDLESTPGGPDRALISALDWGQQIGDRRYRQDLIRPGEQVYVHGTATRVGAREFGGNDFEIVASADDGHHDADLFLVSDRSEDDLIAARRHAIAYLVGGGVLALVGLALLVSGLLPTGL
ncbi:E3 ubiquitin ligase family protein [Halorarius litoreus]|uniref:E3 ubiquitin ligase family protein n=1 Tax=Halorarius litoreus TaxID=2962676 RepID=UPI0020CFC602|nr:E3 ubiquitin ligase family protein [Halorarius litoreus]